MSNPKISPEYYAPFGDDGDPFSHGLIKTVEAPIECLLDVAFGRLDVYQAGDHDFAEDPGPYITVLDHRSSLDIPLAVIINSRLGLQNATRLPFKSEYLESEALSRIYHLSGGLAITRKSAAVGAFFKAAGRMLEQGQDMAIFHEGTRIRGFEKVEDPDTGKKMKVPTGIDLRQIQDVDTGATWISAATGVPIVPIGLAGTADTDTRKAFGRGKPIVAVVGDPIVPGFKLEFDERGRPQVRGISDDLRQLSKDVVDYQQSALDIAYWVRDNTPAKPLLGRLLEAGQQFARR